MWLRNPNLLRSEHSNTVLPSQPILGSNILKTTSVTYSSDEEECAAKLYASIPHVSDDYALDPDSQKCIIGSYGRDACTVSKFNLTIFRNSMFSNLLHLYLSLLIVSIAS